jgi:peroxiredoxin
MRRKQIILAVFFSLFISAMLFFLLKNNLVDDSSKFNNLNKDSFQTDVLYGMIENREREYLLSNTTLNFEIEDINGVNINIDEVTKKRKLVLCYSEINCDVCVDSAIHYFINFSKKIGTENTMILVKYDSPTNFSKFVRLNKIRTNNIYRISAHNFSNLEFDRPYVFLLEVNKQIRDVFCPLKEIPILSEIYYNTIKQKYFK